MGKCPIHNGTLKAMSEYEFIYQCFNLENWLFPNVISLQNWLAHFNCRTGKFKQTTFSKLLTR